MTTGAVALPDKTVMGAGVMVAVVKSVLTVMAVDVGAKMVDVTLHGISSAYSAREKITYVG